MSKLRGLLITTLAIFLCMVSVAISTTSVHALQSVPYQMNFQGRLNNSAGAPMAAGNYNMKFRIYSASTGGSALWTEQRANSASTGVTVTNGGLFTVQLGSVTSLPPAIFNSSSPLYLEVELPTPATATCTVAGCESYTEGAMTPRNAVASSPYAINSDLLDGLDSSAFALASGSANYIQNGLTAQTANFNISGNGTIGGSGTVTGSFTNNGSALFANTSDSPAAFTIQTSAAAKLFVADTTNARIYIGNPAGDSSATLLVVDNSSQASDPAGVAGAIYYNTSMNKFRCYEAGAWVNCTDGAYPQILVKATRTNALTPTTTATALPFTTATVNVGTAYNTSTGIFTAPATGIYQFNSNVTMSLPGGTGNRNDYFTDLYDVTSSTTLQQDWAGDSSASGGLLSSSQTFYSSTSISNTTSLAAGEKVAVRIAVSTAASTRTLVTNAGANTLQIIRVK